MKDVYILDDRSVLYISGLDTNEFLQNLISNNINKVQYDNSCFASLLTPQGKFLCDFLIIKYKKGYLIDCEKKQAETLLNKLNLYKLRSKIEILNLSNEFVVAAFSYEKFMSFKGAKDKPGNTFKLNEDSVFLDPRQKKLGGRLIINLEKLHLTLKKIDLIPSKQENYYSLSHKLGVPQVDMIKLQNKLFGIECNFEELNGIDFKKGCFVGQENTARIKLKNKLSKRLLPLKLVKGKLNEDESIFNKENEIGKVLINNKYPFGLIKYTSEYFSNHIEFKSKNAILKITKPSWLDLNEKNN